MTNSFLGTAEKPATGYSMRLGYQIHHKNKNEPIKHGKNIIVIIRIQTSDNGFLSQRW